MSSIVHTCSLTPSQSILRLPNLQTGNAEENLQGIFLLNSLAFNTTEKWSCSDFQLEPRSCWAQRPPHPCPGHWETCLGEDQRIFGLMLALYCFPSGKFPDLCRPEELKDLQTKRFSGWDPLKQWRQHVCPSGSWYGCNTEETIFESCWPWRDQPKFKI